MGKIIRQNVNILLSALGNYAFPNGKPTLDWNGGDQPTYSISKTIGTGLSASGGGTSIDYGNSLEVTISITNNLYVIDDDNVEVSMGGQPLAGAWNASTKKVHIADVTGDVVINVPSLTYVSSNLAFHLDCKNRGGTSGHWKDLIGSKDFTLTSVTEADTGMVFNGSSSKAVYEGSLEIPYDEGTIEFVIASKTLTNGDMVLWNGYDGGIGAGFWDYNGNKGIATAFSINAPSSAKYAPCTVANACNSLSNALALIDGEEVTPVASNAIYWILTNGVSTGSVTIGARKKSNGTWTYSSITIKAIRVYSSQLTKQQALQNYKVDKKRFNIS